MKIERFGERIMVGVLVAVLALAVVLAGCQRVTPAPASRSGDATVFTNVEVGGTLAVKGATTLTGAIAADGGLTAGGGYGSTGCTISTAGALSCDGATTIGGALGLTGNATLAGQVAFTAAPTVIVTANSTIATGNYTVVPLTAAGAVGTSTITGCSTEGKVTVLRNTANVTITITDTSTIMLGGNAALGQYDTLTLLGDGTNCLQISKADN